ncbi:hypothetical protein F4815DRAFT_297397 [Daldinia loculata]|nr:hypothetical protein F4815DRAFT_297397 [Daldinia loculata]
MSDLMRSAFLFFRVIGVGWFGVFSSIFSIDVSFTIQIPRFIPLNMGLLKILVCLKLLRRLEASVHYLDRRVSYVTSHSYYQFHSLPTSRNLLYLPKYVIRTQSIHS